MKKWLLSVSNSPSTSVIWGNNEYPDLGQQGAGDHRAEKNVEAVSPDEEDEDETLACASAV
jgi:hypothetical protein